MRSQQVLRSLSSASQASESGSSHQSRVVSYTNSVYSTQSFFWSENLEPLDYEDVMNEQSTSNNRDPLKIHLSFPLDDLQIYLLPRPWRTVQPVVPPEPM